MPDNSVANVTKCLANVRQAVWRKPLLKDLRITVLGILAICLSRKMMDMFT